MNRELGGAERFYWVANQWSPNNVVAACTLEGTLDPARLRSALGLLVARHPLLATRVLADARGHDPRFVRRPRATLPLRSVAIAAGDFEGTLDQLVESALNEPLDPAEALASVHYAYATAGDQSALVFTCLHIVADATSAMVSLRDLLRIYEQLSRDARFAITRLPTRPAYGALTPSAWQGARALPRVALAQGRLALEQLRARPVRLAKVHDVPVRERKNRLLRRTLSAPSLRGIRQACSARLVSVHGLLTAALALSVASELGLNERDREVLNVGSPVSLRARLSPPVGDELGSYVATLNVLVQVGRRVGLWSAARAVKRELDSRKQRDEELAMMSLADWVAPASYETSERFVALAEARGPGNLCVSNIGWFDFPEEVSGIRVRDAHWSASLSVTGYLLCAVCSTGSGLSLAFSYLDELVPSERAERIVDHMLTLLTGVAEQVS